MFGAVDIAGAGQRLLPEHIPLRFFGTAMGFHVLAWCAIFVAASEIPRFAGGLGPVLASVHLMTLGVLVITAGGASLQMLPVALGREAPAAAACNAVYVALVTGTVLLAAGFARYDDGILTAGAAVATAGLGVYVVTVVRIVWGARELPVVLLHVWTALAAITAAAAVAVALSVDYGYGFLADHGRVALIHAVLAGYGFMGMLALGLSQVVVPLFAVSLVPENRQAFISFGLALGGLVLAIGGLLAAAPMVVGIATLSGLAGAVLHVRFMEQIVASRMRKRLSPEFHLIRGSWFFLCLSLLLAAGLQLDVLPPSGPALFAFTLIFGWLLTLLVGVLQRIVPLLASMNSGRLGRLPAAPSSLTPERPLRIHRWCHFAAIVIVLFGVLVERTAVIRLGALCGVIAGGAFAAFIVIVLRRTSARAAAPAAQRLPT